MKLKYETREARRHRRNSPIWFRCVHTRKVKCHRPYMFITTFDGYMWSTEYQRWVAHGEPLGNEGADSHLGMGTACFRKFKRLLRAWSKYLPAGVEFILCGRFQGVTITGRIPKRRTRARLLEAAGTALLRQT